MTTYRCKQCQTIWNSFDVESTCPNCYDKSASPIASEKSIRVRLLHTHENWSLEYRGDFGTTDRYEKISWKEKPSQHILHETLNEYLKKMLEE